MLIVVHSLLLSGISFLHLAFKELSVFMVNLTDLVIKSSFLVFIVLSIKSPHTGLLINMGFFHLFSQLLLLNLSRQLLSHSLLVWFMLVVHELVVESVLNFFLFLKNFNFEFFISGLLIHLLENSISHSSHKFLSSFFPSLKFLCSVLFLL